MPPTHLPEQRARTEDQRDARSRLGHLLDPGSLTPLGPWDDSGVLAARGRIHGVPVTAYCTDATRMGGALGAAGADRIVEAINTACVEGCPVVGLWHSGGARLADGVASLDGAGRMFAAMTRASGVVPQISVILGPAAGAAAYGPALTDLVIMADEGRLFVTGPDIVRRVTGEDVDMLQLGGPDTHSRGSGVAHLTASSEREALSRARRLVDLLGRQGVFGPAAGTGSAAAPARDPSARLPDNRRRAYDVRPVVRDLLDPPANPPPGGTADGELVELQARWAANVMIGLGRLRGRTVGVIANNPLRRGGCLDSASAEKAARFVRLCDAFGVPLVVLVDVPGYLPGARQEWDGVLRRGAKLLHAFAGAVVPRATIILRKSYGGAYIAMNSRSLGANAVFAWPDAEVAVMSASAAVEVIRRRELAAVGAEERPALLARLAGEHEREAGGLERAVTAGFVDEVIEPVRSRDKLVAALAAAPARRGRHPNIPL
ncbi:acyl-CoA carboxylase subunit beta [Frankia sp. AgW1.1]|uniref:acyl-CoA carboxylase subunit beta n=1 Tax=Frankia sp. AgW1.1 TaxID=1836971 RepID=UPI0019339F13|nr:carboxyl transferase domain-containing protein [Frankia sp. AgW1.1]MBL7492869.1 acyl-CoA carboxylase subunit beta [Frankia sp. AgW1.1]